jgi:Bax protein
MHLSAKHRSVSFIIGLLVLLPAVTSAAERFEFESYKEVAELFEAKGYTPQTWQEGIREVPRIYLTSIPERWKDKTSKEISVTTKKRIFFRALAPLILRSNEMILADREQCLAIHKSDAPTEADQKWLLELARKYRVGDSAATTLEDKQLEELLKRLDIIPPSLALAQAAEESGWGTSRFASAGNSLFGQWTWGGKGIPPREQQEGKGDYGVAAFESPLQSVVGYMRNLNTHSAYAPLRVKRAGLRHERNKITGMELVGTLVDYSQRGEDYVKSLTSIMTYNKLQPADDAYLGDKPNIELVPVGEGSE